MNGHLVETPALDVFEQMAFDEALAQSQPTAFCLRFFRWQGAGLTFGYAQRIREVERALPKGVGENYTRRPTGGGIVPHFDDLTFSCVFPEDGVLRPLELYRRLHSAIWAGLCEAGLDAQLCAKGGSTAPRGPEGASQCFQKPVALDIVLGDGKILGGAIRRTGTTVLYQGSLQLPGARAQADVLEALIMRSLGVAWGLRWVRQEPSATVQAAAVALEAKYRSPEWIRKL